MEFLGSTPLVQINTFLELQKIISLSFYFIIIIIFFGHDRKLIPERLFEN